MDLGDVIKKTEANTEQALYSAAPASLYLADCSHDFPEKISVSAGLGVYMIILGAGLHLWEKMARRKQEKTGKVYLATEFHTSFMSQENFKRTVPLVESLNIHKKICFGIGAAAAVYGAAQYFS
jgi:hypothetical protein